MGSCFRRRREFNASSSIHPIPPNRLCERFAARVGRQGGEGRAASRPGRHRVRSRGFRFASSLTSDSLRKETALRRTKTYSNRHDAVRLITSDACIGLAESAAEFFLEAAWQRCVVHWYRNIFSHVPATKVLEIAAMLRAIPASGGSP